MTTDIPAVLVKVAELLNGRFSFNGRPLTHEEVFSLTGLLPGIARRADQLCSLCLGYGIGLTLEETEGTPLGIKVVFDDLTPNTLRIFCLIDVLMELMKTNPKDGMTPLDQLSYD